MSYHQKQYPFYNPALTPLSIGNSNLVVNYTDMLDESCVEFKHVHVDCYEIYYCIQGTHHLMVEEERLTLTANSFVLIRPNTSHYTVYEPNLPKRYVVFVFTEPTVNAAKTRSRTAQAEDSFLSDVLAYFQTHTYFLGRDAVECGSILRNLSHEITGDCPGKKIMIDALYQQYIICILRYINQQYDFSAPAEVPLSNLNMAVMITKYMHKNYNRNITIQDIANEFFISTRHVNRVFEGYFGQSFKKTLNIYRLNYAKNYLYDTDYSIEQISRLVGLSSPKMLYQLFKEIDGITVAEFCRTCSRRSPDEPGE